MIGENESIPQRTQKNRRQAGFRPVCGLFNGETGSTEETDDAGISDTSDVLNTWAGSRVPIHFSGFLYNGRFDKYKDEVLSRMKSDTFFFSMIKENKYSHLVGGWNLQSDYVQNSTQ